TTTEFSMLSLHDALPIFFRAALDECDTLLRSHLDQPLLSVLFDTAQDILHQTAYTQPALFALEYALAQLWRSWGVQPTALLGHRSEEHTSELQSRENLVC